MTRKVKTLSTRLIVTVAVAGFGLLAGAGAAPAASCRWNPVCPYQGLQVIGGGSDPAALDGPFGVARTPAGDVVVADYSRQDIREFTADGRLVRAIGTSGQFTTLRAIAVDHATGEIYASDYGCVYWFTADGRPDGQRWCIGYDPKVSRQLTTIAVGPGGRLYAREDVNDPANPSAMLENVITLGPNHQLASRWPVTYGPGDGIIEGEPFGVDGQGNVYLPGGGWVHEFDASGTFLRHIPLTVSEFAIEILGSTLYAESETSGGRELTAYDLTGQQLSPTVPLQNLESDGSPGTCCSPPMSPAFAADGSGITAATADHRIEQLAPDGTVLNAWGGLSTAQISPRAAVGDAAGNIYVVDMTSGHHRVLKYDAQGDPPIAIADLDADFSGGVTSATATTDAHGNILIHSSGTVVTMDTTGHVISVVKLDCQYCGGQIATAPNGTIYAIDWQDVGVFAPSGARLGTMPITTRYLATDAAGNVYAAAAGGAVGEYDSSGHLVRSWDPGGTFEPTSIWSLSTGADGRFYAAATDGIRVYNPSGMLIAAWWVGEIGTVSATPAGDVEKHAAVAVTLQAVYRTGSKWTTVRRRFTLKRHQSGPQLLAAALRRHSTCVGPRVDRAGGGGRLRSLRRFFNLGVRVSCRSGGGSIDDLTFRRGVVRRRALTAAAKVQLAECVLPSSLLVDELRIRGFDAVCHALRGRRAA